MLSKKIGRGNNRIRKELHAIKIMNERKKMSKKIVRSTISSIYGQTKHKFETSFNSCVGEWEGDGTKWCLKFFWLNSNFFLNYFQLNASDINK